MQLIILPNVLLHIYSSAEQEKTMLS